VALKKKFSLLFFSLFAILLAISFYTLLNEEIRFTRIGFLERISLSSEHIKNGMVALMLEGKGRDFQHYLSQEARGDIKTIRLIRDDGVIIGSSNPQEVGQQFSLEGLRLSELNDVRKEIEDFQKGASSFYIPLFNEMPCQRCHKDNKQIRAILAIDVSSAKYISTISGIKQRGIFYFITILIISFPFIWLFTGLFIEKPFKDILRVINAVIAHDLTMRVATDRDDELGQLGRGLNNILSELERTKRDFELCHLSEMRRVQEMATLGELASAVAHEIRNPLAGISGAIQVLSEDFPESDPRQSIIKEILKEVERLERSIKDLLVFARTPEPLLKHVPAKLIFERLIRFIEPQALKNNVSVKMDLSSEVDEIYVDVEQIHQAFFNIAQYSIQNMPEGGNLTIVVKKINKEYAISFSDTGQGIHPDEIKFLFKPFYSRGFGITSLGLTISRGIIERHGGRVEVESIIGKGTTFTVYLPISEGDNKILQ
jgi:signal transduction histidine kinase